MTSRRGKRKIVNCRGEVIEGSARYDAERDRWTRMSAIREMNRGKRKAYQMRNSFGDLREERKRLRRSSFLFHSRDQVQPAIFKISACQEGARELGDLPHTIPSFPSKLQSTRYSIPFCTLSLLAEDM